MNLAADRVSLFVIGKGTVGGALLDILAEERPYARGGARRRDSPRRGGVVRLARSFAGIGAHRGGRGDGETRIALCPRRSDERHRPCSVDCTAGEGMEDIYAEKRRSRGAFVS